MSNLCTICGEFMDITEFEISDEILEWQNYFYHIAKKYDLEDEFNENGVI